MVVGGGMLARAFSRFSAHPHVVIFASGVSDSNERDPAQFSRETTMLTEVRQRHPDQLLVYFGTCSVEDPERSPTPYVRHKLAAESLLEGAGHPWLVLRLPLVIGPRHKSNTLAEYLYGKISRGESFEVWKNAIRYPLDVADVLTVSEAFIGMRQYWNRRINVAFQAYPVLEFVRIFEEMLDAKANCTLSPKGSPFALDCPELRREAGRLGLQPDEGYLRRTLQKYFAP
jgi:nucleoside-diphosphate-sugar epimerase